jgi:hypothetical protein
MITSRRMRREGHLELMGRRWTRIELWWESQKKRDNQENIDVGGSILLRGILERYNGVLWAGLIWFRIGTNGGILGIRWEILEWLSDWWLLKEGLTPRS